MMPPPGVGDRWTRTMVLGLLVLPPMSQSVGSAMCPPPGAEPLSQFSLVGADDTDPQSPTWTGFELGTRAEYRCDRGYVLVGDRGRACQPDGRWDGAAPHCYLNLAEYSDLSVKHPLLVDGDLATFVRLRRRKLSVKLYSTTLPPARPLQGRLELRVLTGADTDLSRWKASFDFTHTSIKLRLGMPRPLPGSDLLAYSHDVVLHGDDIDEKVREISLSPPSLDAEDGSQVTIHELLVVDYSTGVSRHRCSPEDTTVTRTWAAGELCYHLVDMLNTKQKAEEWCRDLGENGALMQVTGEALRQMVADILREEEMTDATIWVAGSRDTSDSPWLLSGTEWPLASTLFTKVKGGLCAVIKQIAKWSLEGLSCHKMRPFLCQTAPPLCGSPAQQPSLLYQSVANAQWQEINVTCVGDRARSGAIRCRHGRWSRPPSCGASDQRHGGWSGALAPALAAAAAVLLLLTACGLTLARRRHRRRADRGPDWVSYGLMERIRGLSRRGGRQHNHTPEAGDPIYSEIVYEDMASFTGTKALLAIGGPSHARKSWLHGPVPQPPASVPGTTEPDCDQMNRLYQSTDQAQTSSSSGRRQPGSAVGDANRLYQSTDQAQTSSSFGRRQPGSAVGDANRLYQSSDQAQTSSSSDRLQPGSAVGDANRLYQSSGPDPGPAEEPPRAGCHARSEYSVPLVDGQQPGARDGQPDSSVRGLVRDGATIVAARAGAANDGEYAVPYHAEVER